MLALAFGFLPGCNRKEEEERADRAVSTSEGASEGKSNTPAAPHGGPEKGRRVELIFPDGLRVADPEVNQLIEDVLNVCASANYEEFRLLWSARHDPLSRDEFAQSWPAVRHVRVRALEKAMIETAAEEVNKGGDPAAQSAADAALETVYLTLVEVEVDPAHRVAERLPDNSVVLMLVRENGRWRLANATKTMRNWLKEKVARG